MQVVGARGLGPAILTWRIVVPSWVAVGLAAAIHERRFRSDPSCRYAIMPV